MSFLRALFGPGKDEIWQQFCTQIGAQFVAGGFWSGSKVEATHGQWTVTLDTHTVSAGKSSTTYTRIRAPYLNPDGFTFTIYQKSIFTALGKWMGMQDVTVGYPEFDETFVIKGNDEQKLRRLFSNKQIRDLISVQPDIRFFVDNSSVFGTGTFPNGVEELHFEVIGIITDIERLKLLFELFSETLDELCRMGSARDESPGIQL
jgi:hypothetical protein